MKQESKEGRGQEKCFIENKENTKIKHEKNRHRENAYCIYFQYSLIQSYNCGASGDDLIFKIIKYLLKEAY